MISVNEAKSIIQAATKLLQPVRVPLQTASGLVLAQDVYTQTDIPPFDQSAMDGYAFAFDDLDNYTTLSINGEVPAGYQKTFQAFSGQAVRIFTGAPVPQGADTVVMQEKVSVLDNTLQINDTELQKGSNVRLQGSEVKRDALALKQYAFLSPAAIGFLAAIGITDVLVYPKPSIALIITGNELQQPGHSLLAGQVYESNSFMLHAALQQLHVSTIQLFFCDDNLDNLQTLLKKSLPQFDMILLTGGVSAGDYDFVVQATTGCGVLQQFHKVAQKPGKPLYFGTWQETIVFGLPGNPSSVLTCFYQYVITAIEAMTGRSGLLKTTQCPLAAPYNKKAGLTHFLKGWYEGGKVMPLQAQESYKLNSFAMANCLITLDAERSDYSVGDLVTVHLLPF